MLDLLNRSPINHPGLVVLGRWEPSFVLYDDYAAPIDSRFHGAEYHADVDKFAYDWYMQVKYLTPMPLVYISSFTVRSPRCHFINSGTANFRPVQDFHQDNDDEGNSGFYHWMFLWASAHPTEIEIDRQSGAVWTPQPFDVVAVKNDLFRHRCPPSITKPRWFARGYGYQ